MMNRIISKTECVEYRSDTGHSSMLSISKAYEGIDRMERGWEIPVSFHKKEIDGYDAVVWVNISFTVLWHKEIEEQFLPYLKFYSIHSVVENHDKTEYRKNRIPFMEVEFYGPVDLAVLWKLSL